MNTFFTISHLVEIWGEYYFVTGATSCYVSQDQEFLRMKYIIEIKKLCDINDVDGHSKQNNEKIYYYMLYSFLGILIISESIQDKLWSKMLLSLEGSYKQIFPILSPKACLTFRTLPSSLEILEIVIFTHLETIIYEVPKTGYSTWGTAWLL